MLPICLPSSSREGPEQSARSRFGHPPITEQSPHALTARGDRHLLLAFAFPRRWQAGDARAGLELPQLFGLVFGLGNEYGKLMFRVSA